MYKLYLNISWNFRCIAVRLTYFINSLVRRFLLSDLEYNFRERLHMMKYKRNKYFKRRCAQHSNLTRVFPCFRRLRRPPRASQRTRTRPDDSRGGAEAEGGGDGGPGPGQGLLHHPPGQPRQVPAWRGHGKQRILGERSDNWQLRVQCHSTYCAAVT